MRACSRARSCVTSTYTAQLTAQKFCHGFIATSCLQDHSLVILLYNSVEILEMEINHPSLHYVCFARVQDRPVQEIWDDFERQEKVFKEEVAEARERNALKKVMHSTVCLHQLLIVLSVTRMCFLKGDSGRSTRDPRIAFAEYDAHGLYSDPYSCPADVVLLSIPTPHHDLATKKILVEISDEPFPILLTSSRSFVPICGRHEACQGRSACRSRSRAHGSPSRRRPWGRGHGCGGSKNSLLAKVHLLDAETKNRGARGTPRDEQGRGGDRGYLRVGKTRGTRQSMW